VWWAKLGNTHTTEDKDFLFSQIPPAAGGGDLKVELLFTPLENCLLKVFSFL